MIKSLRTLAAGFMAILVVGSSALAQPPQPLVQSPPQYQGWEIPVPTGRTFIYDKFCPDGLHGTLVNTADGYSNPTMVRYNPEEGFVPVPSTIGDYRIVDISEDGKTRSLIRSTAAGTELAVEVSGSIRKIPARIARGAMYSTVANDGWSMLSYEDIPSESLAMWSYRNTQRPWILEDPQGYKTNPSAVAPNGNFLCGNNYIPIGGGSMQPSGVTWYYSATYGTFICRKVPPTLRATLMDINDKGIAGGDFYDGSGRGPRAFRFNALTGATEQLSHGSIYAIRPDSSEAVGSGYDYVSTTNTIAKAGAVRWNANGTKDYLSDITMMSGSSLPNGGSARRISRTGNILVDYDPGTGPHRLFFLRRI